MYSNAPVHLLLVFPEFVTASKGNDLSVRVKYVRPKFVSGIRIVSFSDSSISSGLSNAMDPSISGFSPSRLPPSKVVIKFDVASPFSSGVGLR